MILEVLHLYLFRKKHSCYDDKLLNLSTVLDFLNYFFCQCRHFVVLAGMATIIRINVYFS